MAVTYRTDFFKELYSLLKDNMTESVTFVQAYEINYVDFPRVALPVPTVNRMKERFSDGDIREGTADIEIVSEDLETTLRIADDIENAIYENRDLLPVDRITIGTSEPAPIELEGGIYYSYTVPLEFISREW